MHWHFLSSIRGKYCLYICKSGKDNEDIIIQLTIVQAQNPNRARLSYSELTLDFVVCRLFKLSDSECYMSTFKL